MFDLLRRTRARRSCPDRSGGRRTTAYAFVSAGVLATALSVVGPGAAGCYTHQCDASAYDFGGGRFLDADTYETNAIDERWLDFPPNVTIHIQYPGVARRVASVLPYIGTSKFPDGSSGARWTLASGANAQWYSDESGNLYLVNGTCAANYYVRAVVSFDPAAVTDGGMGVAMASDSASE